MSGPDFPRTIMEFQERFATEAACLEYLAASRWPAGFVCPACGGVGAWVLERRHLWECGACRLQTSVTAGTVMHGTRTPLRLWFWAAYLVATHHPGISAKQLQGQLGLSRYETAWLILQKLRRAMVAPERELLKDEIEVDERNPPRRRQPTPPGLSRRVRLSRQPPAHPDGSLPNAPRTERAAPAHHLPPDHPHNRGLSKPDTNVACIVARTQTTTEKRFQLQGVSMSGRSRTRTWDLFLIREEPVSSPVASSSEQTRKSGEKRVPRDDWRQLHTTT